MKRVAIVFAFLLCCVTASADDVPKRPHIYGIAYVKILVTNMDKSRDFYALALQSIPRTSDVNLPCDWCERAPIAGGLEKNDIGPIELEAIHTPGVRNLLSEVAFNTDNAKALRDFLLKNNVAAEKLTTCRQDPCFATSDPEHHRLIFVQSSGGSRIGVPGAYPALPTGSPIIHAGFVVQNRAEVDHFYKDILGFRPYWHGGMKDDETSWVSMQVPDGTDWVEYMLNIPLDANKHLLGVMNHVALGVTDIHATQQQLIKNGWKPGEEPKLGRDGKWQLNLYDPDDTRVEFMEYTPKEKPCCSDFTGPHPGPEAGQHP